MRLYFVLADNGLGNSGNSILGVYPTEELAEEMVEKHETEYGYVGVESLEYDSENGTECFILVSG